MLLRSILWAFGFLLISHIANAGSLPPVSEWKDEQGEQLLVAYGESQMTTSIALDRDRAIENARVRLAAFLGRGEIEGSMLIREWRRPSLNGQTGLHIVAIGWSARSEQTARSLKLLMDRQEVRH